jgi:hypothetical protein
MKIDTFLAHYDIGENPFGAEEARHDPVFDRLIEQDLSHPEFAKILGQVDRPGSCVVFGEKGSGKTAIRIMLADQIARHNAEHPGRLVLVVPYDDLNPVLDRLQAACGGDAETALDELRLADHQDAILSAAVTRLNDAVLGEQADDPTAKTTAAHRPRELRKILRKTPRRSRVDLAVLSALYDQPQTGSPMTRWRKLRRRLGLGWAAPVPWLWVGASLTTIAAVGLGAALWWVNDSADKPLWLLPALGVGIAGAVLTWSAWCLSAWRRRLLCRRVLAQMPVVKRTRGDLSRMLEDLGAADLAGQPLPTGQGKAGSDSRYQLTRRFVEVLGGFGYAGMVVLVDRVDEPTLIHGRADRMRAVVWPMFDNKFLQQKGVGIKLLLPLELRHQVHRESPAFFEEARLDKQHLIDRLTWSGATLYDLCSSRLRACQAMPHDAPAHRASPHRAEPHSETPAESGKPIQLMDLFQPDVSRDAVIDALDQMQQPRDAFKFLYGLIQEHCRLSPEDEPRFRIARITLDNVRRAQAQRVQDLQRGLSPA